MPIFSLLLATAFCADPAYCPSTGQLTQAVSVWDRAQASIISPEDERRYEIIIVSVRQAREVAGIRCGNPAGTAQRAVTCQALYRYREGPTLRSFRLTRKESGWSVLSS